ncbi:MAG: methyltransferase domain-containing protein [Bacillota bacterium]|nr:methyltransferase domain-containing protein [Bacillota bacterium]
MSGFRCPVCKSELLRKEKNMVCANNHNFDVAKSGYVNLLLSQKAKTRHHGDDKKMVTARRDFLNKGYYRPLLESICEITQSLAFNGCRILDAGCGECWYTANIYEYLKQIINVEMIGIDVSKDALTVGAKRNHEIEIAVASIFDLPVSDNSCDIILSLFAPLSISEFKRVVKDNGVIIRAVPLERHLWNLKKAVYDDPYENDIESFEIDGFELQNKIEIRDTIHLESNEDIENVFTMTPYYYKTSDQDKEKLKFLTKLDTEIEFGILVYRRI